MFVHRCDGGAKRIGTVLGLRMASLKVKWVVGNGRGTFRPGTTSDGWEVGCFEGCKSRYGLTGILRHVIHSSLNPGAVTENKSMMTSRESLPCSYSIVKLRALE